MKKLVLSVLVVLAGTTLFAQDATKNDAKKNKFPHATNFTNNFRMTNCNTL